MRALRFALLFVLTVPFLQAWGEESRALVTFQQGITALKAADADRSKLLDAIGFLSSASEGFVREGNEQSATDANALLYWCRKKLTIDEINALRKRSPKAATKAEAVVTAKVQPKDAKAWLERADDYASRVSDPLLKAARYFEVADRFKNTPEGFKALRLSLKLMQQVGSRRDVAGAAEKGDGKVYVTSEPPGASVLLEAKDGLRDCGVRTPGLVMLPKGRAQLVLRLDGHADGQLAVTVGDAIVKPKAVTLVKQLCTVDIVDNMKGGWRVFVGGKAATDKMRKPAVTPCTVQLPAGNCEIVLAKEGFSDVTHAAAIQGASMVVEVKGTAAKGKSALLEAPLERFVGKWKKVDSDTIFYFKENGTISAPTAMIRGTWKVQGDEVILIYSGRQVVLKVINNDLLKGKWEFERR